MNLATLDRLREMAKEPERQAMSRGVQYPSLAQQHLVDEQEIMRLRVALGEAVTIIDSLRIQLREPPRDGGDL
jgi:hypothetical protein